MNSFRTSNFKQSRYTANPLPILSLSPGCNASFESSESEVLSSNNKIGSGIKTNSSQKRNLSKESNARRQHKTVEGIKTLPVQTFNLLNYTKMQSNNKS